MAFRRQVIVSTVFIIMFILLMDKHMRFAISGEKINAENYEYAIITDARFCHELDFIGESFKIFIKSNEEIAESNHISERNLDNYIFDYEINNIDKPNLSPAIDEIYSILTKRN